MSIYKNTQIVLNKAAQAAERVGRRAEDVLVVGVTKTVGVESVAEMVCGGIKVAGENRVQELLAKKKALPELEFHLIGHLQSNKVKQAVEAAGMIHSVDSFRVMEMIDKYAGVAGKKMDVLVQINVAGEDTKFGMSVEDAVDTVFRAGELENVCVRGLMCIPPFVDDPEKNRGHFRKMFEIYVDINGKFCDNRRTMDVLSMGMTSDYEVAIEEGATIVRVGTAIFGERVL